MRALLAITTIILVAVTGATAQTQVIPLEEFKEKRTAHRLAINEIRAKKCRHPIHPFRLWASKIPEESRRGVLRYWRNRHIQAREFSNRCWIKLDRGNFDVVLEKAAKTFRISYRWIHACSHDEGNTHFRGPIWNNQGSGAFGWMQFMRSTFYSHVNAAFYVARNRGDKIPNSFKRWNSKVGQAYTAAYMFYRGYSSQWTGASC